MTSLCPKCGVEVSPNAKACSECRVSLGKETTAVRRSWETDSHLDGVDLPLSDEDFDYDQFLEEEFGQKDRGSMSKINGIAWYYWLAGVLLLVSMALAAFW